MAKLIICVLTTTLLVGCVTEAKKYEKQLINAGCKPNFITGGYRSYYCVGVEGYPPTVTIWE